MKCSVFLLPAVFLYSFAGFGQKGVSPGRPVSPGSPNPGLPNTNTNTNPRNPTTQPNNTSPYGADIARPVFLSGKVVLDDGTPPPEPVRIEKICGATPRPQGYTDMKGRFSFQLDSGIGVMADASDSSFGSGGFGQQQPRLNGNNPNMDRSYSGCEIRASLPGFRSDSLNLSFHRAFDNPDIGTIVLHRMAGVVGTTISFASLNAPKDAQKAFEKGREALKKEKQADAEKQFRKAVEIYPGYASVWYELGRMESARNQPQDAAADFQKAIAADPKFISPYLDLTFMAARANDWAQTLDLTDRAIRLNASGFPQAYYYNALANLNLRHLENAEKSAREAQKLDTRHSMPKTGQLLSAILVERQDYSGAAQQMRSYLEANPNAQDASKVRAQLAELEKLSPPATPPR
ncbi:MAG: tetratricopeptide repeat protein [Acidobacteriota bacterium]|nr:tetratricopeptide repeat protein [Acidobacteriota bacterium]